MAGLGKERNTSFNKPSFKFAEMPGPGVILSIAKDLSKHFASIRQQILRCAQDDTWAWALKRQQAKQYFSPVSFCLYEVTKLFLEIKPYASPPWSKL